MTAILISRAAQAQLQIAQWIRNGKAPVAEIQNQLATLVGFAASVRTKQVFRSPGNLFGAGEAKMVPSSLATRKRWRGAFHSGSFANFLYVRFELCPQDNGTATDPYAICELKDTTDTVVGIATMHYGSSDGSYADDPINNGGGVARFVNPTDSSLLVTLSSDAEYTLTFSDVGFARLQSAEAHVVAFPPNTIYGYVQNTLGAGAPIVAADRRALVQIARGLHKRCGTPVMSWHSDLDSTAPGSTSSAAGEGALAESIGAIGVTATGSTGINVLNESIGNVTASAHGTTAELAVEPSSDTTTPAPGSDFTVTVTVTTNDIEQHNGIFGVRIGPAVGHNDGTYDLVSSVETDDAAGWDVNDDWSIVDNYWVARFGKDTLDPSTHDELSFFVTVGASARVADKITVTTNQFNTGTPDGVVDGTGQPVLTDEAEAPLSLPVTAEVTA